MRDGCRLYLPLRMYRETQRSGTVRKQEEILLDRPKRYAETSGEG